jgi:hypothetical protein
MLGFRVFTFAFGGIWVGMGLWALCSVYRSAGSTSRMLDTPRLAITGGISLLLIGGGFIAAALSPDPSISFPAAMTWAIVVGLVANRLVKRELAKPSPSRPPCPYCGKPLRTPLARQCQHCLMDWHDPDQPYCRR